MGTQGRELRRHFLREDPRERPRGARGRSARGSGYCLGRAADARNPAAAAAVVQVRRAMVVGNRARRSVVGGQAVVRPPGHDRVRVRLAGGLGRAATRATRPAGPRPSAPSAGRHRPGAGRVARRARAGRERGQHGSRTGALCPRHGVGFLDSRMVRRRADDGRACRGVPDGGRVGIPARREHQCRPVQCIGCRLVQARRFRPARDRCSGAGGVVPLTAAY